MPPISVLNPDARPRERLLASGPHALADAELLAIVLGAGTIGQSVLDVAHALLAGTGGLGGLSRASLDEVCGQPGVGPARACAVQAALELGRRSVGERPVRGQRLSSAVEVWQHLKARLG